MGRCVSRCVRSSCLLFPTRFLLQGSDWLGDQDAIEYMCREAPNLIAELAEMGLPFSRTRDGCVFLRHSLFF